MSGKIHIMVLAALVLTLALNVPAFPLDEEALGPCAEERQRLEALKKRFGNRLRHLVIPECDAQGYYAPFRCGRTGCWCVDREGNRLLEGSNTPEECEALRGSENDI